ncbi:MAG TPA: hypothetical protein PK514_10610 [Spirochaetota bacterium]|nr:hypothetical protein [Spirochaetota bacterium]
MKKITGIITGIVILLSAVLYSADKNQQAVEFVKNCLERFKLQYGYTAAIRYFQYTSTTAKDNPYSYVLESESDEVLAEANLTNADKGKYIDVLKDRSGVRISRLWKENKNDLFTMVSKESYDNNFAYQVNSLIAFRESKGYNTRLNALRKKSPKLNTSTIEKAGAVTNWDGYKDLAFWYRRTVEKNDKAVYDILKEVQANYK